MSEYQKILESDKEWYENFIKIKVTGKCDNVNCKKKAKYWYGNTSLAYCGNPKCIDYLNDFFKKYDEEQKWLRSLQDDI